MNQIVNVTMKNFLRKVFKNINSIIPKLSGYFRSKKESKALIYALFNTAFDREIYVVTEGKRRYVARSAANEPNQPQLRRNIHRLEKGLLMRPRKDTFAVDYIEETVELLACSLQYQKTADHCEIAWAADVLREYFRVVRGHDAVERARGRFEHLVKQLPQNCGHIPYFRQETNSTIPDYESLLHLANHRRSVRWFEQKPVPRELLCKAMEVARQAPSACNRQPFVFRVFDERVTVRKVASISYGTTGYLDNIPVIVVVVGQLRNFFDERDRHLIYIDASLAVMSFMYALETLGLSSCAINWPDIEEKERVMAELLNLEPDERPVMLLAVGYPDPQGLVASSVKKPLEELIRFSPNEHRN